MSEAFDRAYYEAEIRELRKALADTARSAERACNRVVEGEQVIARLTLHFKFPQHYSIEYVRKGLEEFMGKIS
jgi:hypothetical protein